jgi:hypothetical protein
VHTAAVARPRGRPCHSALPRATRATTRIVEGKARATNARSWNPGGRSSAHGSLVPRGRTCARLLVRRAAAGYYLAAGRNTSLPTVRSVQLRDGADPLGGVEHGEHAREVAGHGEGAEAAEDVLASKGPPGYVRCYLLTSEQALQGCRLSHMTAPARCTT